jgi:hypothetical protein
MPSSDSPDLYDSMLDDIQEKLSILGMPDALVSALLENLPRQALGVILYGSWARGDQGPRSDVDVLVVTEVPHNHSRSVPPISVNIYTQAQLIGASGTLFGMHLSRDGFVLHDAADGILGKVLGEMGPVDVETVLGRIRDASVMARLSNMTPKHLQGILKVTRYLLRSAYYAEAISRGEPCFSVSELAQRYGDVDLNELLSSHSEISTNGASDILESLCDRLETLIGPIPSTEYSNLNSLIVGNWRANRSLADIALLALMGESVTIDYAELPRVLL